MLQASQVVEGVGKKRMPSVERAAKDFQRPSVELFRVGVASQLTIQLGQIIQTAANARMPLSEYHTLDSKGLFVRLYGPEVVTLVLIHGSQVVEDYSDLGMFFA